MNQSANIIKTAVTVLSNTTSDAIDKAKMYTKDTAQKFTDSIEASQAEKWQQEEDKRLRCEEALSVGCAHEFLAVLGESPIKLTPSKTKQIYSVFSIPREQTLLWADAEFDLRPSGVAVTERGVFIRTNATVFNVSKKSKGKKKVEDSSKSLLYYYHWDNFDPAWFKADSDRNIVMSIEPQCRNAFITACQKILSTQISIGTDLQFNVGEDALQPETSVTEVATISAAAVESAETAVFVEQNAYINNLAGHGEMAEEANTMVDKLRGMDAHVIGRDNVKNGADRQIDDILIQTKYYKSARGSLEACFDPNSGTYRYMKDGSPMQLEVPKDQYQKVLEGFKYKIKEGKVPGITDPEEAENFVHKGYLTYQQAVNLTKPGTIESLLYDASTGTVICSCAFGITFVTAVFLTWRKTGDMGKAVEVGYYSGIQVFGISFLQHMVISQISRISLANSLMAPSQYVVERLGYQSSTTIVNGLRALSGKSAINGAAASKQLAKIMRSNVITSAISFAVFSVPETYSLVAQKISGAQYVKNLSVLTSSIAGGAGGTLGAGVAAAKIAGAAGTAIAPGVGTAVGIIGGLVGSVIGAKIVDTAGDVLCEDDAEAFSRLFNAMIACMSSEYMLDSGEMDALVERINKFEGTDFKRLMESTWQSTEQEAVLRIFLSTSFDEIAGERKRFALPNNQTFTDILAETLNPLGDSINGVCCIRSSN